MDFFSFRTREEKDGTFTLFPGFRVGRSTDLMVRGGKFYAVWDEHAGLWSTDEYRVAELVDDALYHYAKQSPTPYTIKVMQNFETGSWSMFQKFINQIEDNSQQLDQKLVFANTAVKKSDYASKRLPYSLEPGDCSAWNELVGTLYNVEERAKIEWIIGAIVSGDSKTIQKFGVFYGPPGSGKGTILDVVERLFHGYTTSFNAKALGGNSDQFATEVFKNDPLVAIQADGDLSRIQDNAKLNSIISHEYMDMNAKFKSIYRARVNAFLLLGTNTPVKISDAKSGIIRRLIDIHPTGVTISNNHYNTLMAQTDFELGAIAHHCLEVYQHMGKNYYGNYRPLEMMLQTDMFFNFIESYFDVFKEQDGTSLHQAYIMFKEYCSNSGIEKPMPQYKFREELRNYFDEFKDRAEVDGHIVRSYYSGFNANKFKAPAKDGPTNSVVLDADESLLDELWANMPAQYATARETPKKKWADVTTKLGELDTRDIHFVKVPDNHIVIDFDLKDDDGEKSLDRNLAAASNWPATYAETSKSGQGIHLHYIWDGDKSMLQSQYSDGIEIKTYLGDASLRRKLTKCNRFEIATISSGLPLKEKKMLDAKTIQSEAGLRSMIIRNLNKEFHGSTKPSVDFIKKLLDDAYESGMQFDVSDLKGPIISFATNSSNQAMACIKLVQMMKFQSEGGVDHFAEDIVPDEPSVNQSNEMGDDRIALFDLEVYPNLFVICWKFEGSSEVVRMVNPTPEDIYPLFKLKLMGYNNRSYDNHLLYAAYLGYSNEDLYNLSQQIIVHKDNRRKFGEAYSISYGDLFDMLSVKMTLKKWQILLGLPHVEMDIPWDKPVPPELWDKVVEYCCNDVHSTDAVLQHRKQDLIARMILADLSGLKVNDTNTKHTARIIFGQDRNPQASFVYTHLKQEFPGYEFDPHKTVGKSSYKGEDPSEGGYVYAEPGMYEDVWEWDVESMHPTSIIQLNLFGKYTPKFKELLDARLAIKHGDYDEARTMMNGALAPHLGNVADAKALSDALKIVINSVYGLTSAKFDNPFRDIRNRDNIVAKRGALFMIDLKHAVQEMGFKVIHIKTDSIKVAKPTAELDDFIHRFGEKYGYNFQHDTTYSRFCLVNDAVYIAKVGWADKDNKIGTWDATGAQFQHPVVYKTLFSKEELTFDDFCETKQVTGDGMYLDFDIDRPKGSEAAPEDMRFVGRTGRFVPVLEGQGGAILYRRKDGKNFKVTGTTGFLWMEADMALSQGAEINMAYFDKLVASAETQIGKFGDIDWFVSGPENQM